jgi:hypothetical protein
MCRPMNDPAGGTIALTPKRPKLSRGFLCALVGIGMTLFSWYGPWAWPAWPAFKAVDLFFGPGGYSELPYAQRAEVLVALIILNVASWAVAIYAALVAFRCLRTCRGA